MDQKIFNHFQQLIETTMVVGDSFAEPMAAAAEKISAVLLAGNRIFSCGERGTVSLAQQFTDYLTMGYEIERPGFPALNINQITTASSASEGYAHCLQTQAQTADLLLVVSSGDNNPSLIGAIEAAISKGMTIILLSAHNDDLLSTIVGYNDVEISMAQFPGQLANAAQFQIIQCLCALVDHQIFGGE